LYGRIFLFDASKATLADHVHDAGIAPDTKGDRKDAEFTCNAAFVFEIDGRVTDGADQGFGVSHGPL